jgi:chromosome partitioning protein
MRHIMVLNPKGGVGKTTIATNLASYFAAQQVKVALADLDPQGCSLAWLNLRSAGRPPIQGIAAFNSPIRPTRTTEFVIMDAPAAVHGKQLADLVRRAETILIPVLPSPIDMRAAHDFINEIKKLAKVAKKKAKLALVANRVKENTVIHWELDDFLSKQQFTFVASLRDSQNYIRAAEQGLGIFEMGIYATATDREQWTPVIQWIKSKRSQP